MIRSALWKHTLLAIGCFALLAPGSAHAFDFAICGKTPIIWESDVEDLNIISTSFPPGGIADQTLRRVMSRWSEVVGSDFLFTPNDGDIQRDFRNDVYLDPTLDPSVISMTFVRSTCDPGVQASIDEVDIAFNANVAWSMGTYNYANPDGPPFNFEGTALHEVGHAFGLLHEDFVQATMNSFYPYGGPLGSAKTWKPFGDDRAGDVFLYPSNDGNVEVDVAGSPLKPTGLGTSGLVSSPSQALRGSTVEVELTLANLGSSPQTFDVAFYLSTDDQIAVSDIPLGRGSVPAFAGATDTYVVMLPIPPNTARRSYFLGFIVDPDNVLVESDEANNAQALPRSITIR